ncbi:hypothetical protein ABZ438_20745 [Streptomyces sp. NPDC005786]|uniref:hypothetical protein n=1 Tax=Streptomyces sp. NPDC005786 TaxID=3154891 RepID=UPI00340A11C7
MSKRTLDLIGDLIRRERIRLGTRWRKVTPGTQALIVLAVLRHDQRLSDMAGGNQISASTCAAGSRRSCGCWPPAPRAWTAP